ncbi:hypothetical protein PCE1_001965 [Barthelona sp. PCE]
MEPISKENVREKPAQRGILDDLLKEEQKLLDDCLFYEANGKYHHKTTRKIVKSMPAELARIYEHIARRKENDEVVKEDNKLKSQRVEEIRTSLIEKGKQGEAMYTNIKHMHRKKIFFSLLTEKCILKDMNLVTVVDLIVDDNRYYAVQSFEERAAYIKEFQRYNASTTHDTVSNDAMLPFQQFLEKFEDIITESLSFEEFSSKFLQNTIFPRYYDQKSLANHYKYFRKQLLEKETFSLKYQSHKQAKALYKKVSMIGFTFPTDHVIDFARFISLLKKNTNIEQLIRDQVPKNNEDIIEAYIFKLFFTNHVYFRKLRLTETMNYRNSINRIRFVNILDKNYKELQRIHPAKPLNEVRLAIGQKSGMFPLNDAILYRHWCDVQSQISLNMVKGIPGDTADVIEQRLRKLHPSLPNTIVWHTMHLWQQRNAKKIQKTQ